MNPVPVIISQYGKFEYTKRCIDSVRKQDIPVEVWLVDVPTPAPDTGGLEELKELSDRVFLLRSNVGFAKANNRALAAALEEGYERVMVLNNDTVLPNDAVGKLMNCMDRHDKSVQIAPKLVYGDGKLQGAGGEIKPKLFEPGMIGNQGDPNLFNEENQVTYACAAAVLVRMNAVGLTGMIPEEYTMYSEDVDWSLRLHRDGGEIWYCPDVTVVHYESVGSGAYHPYKGFYVVRSNIILARKWLSEREWRVFRQAMFWKLLRQSLKYITKPLFVISQWKGFRAGLQACGSIPAAEQASRVK